MTLEPCVWNYELKYDWINVIDYLFISEKRRKKLKLIVTRLIGLLKNLKIFRQLSLKENKL